MGSTKKDKKEKKLIIVESPSKAKTISKYLGKEYEVKASMGHIKDLPVNRMGVDIENNFEPEYVTIKGKEKVIKELKKAAQKAKEVLLASDPDREGEAIAWHIAQELDNASNIKRIIFHEITPKALKEAVKNPTDIDIKKVNAQQARRVLDRLVGYSLSPLLWRRIDKGLSAGRVQSVALRLICEREKEIEEFVPEEYWKIEALLEGSQKPQFTAHLFKYNSKKIERLSKEEADTIFEQLQSTNFILEKVEKKERKKNPKPPFITSTLQQEAFKKLGFSAQKTMYIAQQLYEGIEIPYEGPIGLITYMRTDSVRISEGALKAVRKLIKENFGKEYLPARAIQYKTKEGAQDAHEAIRPTDVYRTPDSLKGKIPEDHWKLYDLIWKRFVASQMKPAVYEVTTFTIKAGNSCFKATGSVLKFPGFTTLYTSDDEEKNILPMLQEGEILKVIKLEKTQHFTTPPPRYTEASLIKKLEEEGIGRPSTYATIVSTIIDRGYVVRDKKALVPTPLGRIVSEVLTRNFPKLIDVSFTANMEEDLDRIAEGSKQWQESIKEFFEVFSKELDDAGKNLLSLEKYSPIKCEKCGKPMVIKKGKYGKFLACSGYPECENVKPLFTKKGGKRFSGKGKNQRHKKNS
ncbi:DNA topoisomerase I [Thermosulfidibacter takaii ABI70S6]|uniref:DNA topoisomerase 1 n=1 Tax=Thermosulfidibacter takaii (strain DSM 17441 / JCM 13301 / NBRC 103674 / ABI70S6) TaxID=1298851 RepID=A0A0S3QU03_THET7|nr:type I DNA topoisomerase [Thermosulfidibacter takaii]BAT71806.1 DNA topoisomerase I [Thermosulfidibacter takaii ABI70S6]